MYFKSTIKQQKWEALSLSYKVQFEAFCKINAIKFLNKLYPSCSTLELVP